jgi:hypothetical protein
MFFQGSLGFAGPWCIATFQAFHYDLAYLGTTNTGRMTAELQFVSTEV